MPDRRIAIYSRKSKFTGKGESIGNQVEICRRAAVSQYGGRDEDIVVFEDEGFSGGSTNRPRFREMLERCREGEFRLVICYRLDRISRNTADFVRTYESLREFGVCFRSVSDNIDDTTPMGKAMMMISSVFAQLERDIIAERITDNMLELAKLGRWLGGRTPAGYRSIATVGSIASDGRERKAVKLELIESETEDIRLIFRKYIELRSLTALADHLKGMGIKSRLGREHTRVSLRGILSNPVYVINDIQAYEWFSRSGMQLYADESEFDGEKGMLAYNKTRQISGKAVKHKALSEWVVAVGRHRGIIPGSEWAEVQELLEQNRLRQHSK